MSKMQKEARYYCIISRNSVNSICTKYENDETNAVTIVLEQKYGQKRAYMRHGNFGGFRSDKYTTGEFLTAHTCLLQVKQRN